MTPPLSRRAFLGTGAAAFLASRSSRSYAANDAVNVAIVGTGGMGAGNRKELAGIGAAIVALCDADRARAEAALKDHPGARIWTDFRKMLLEQKDIDAVMVSTPDHLHAPASMMAMKLGKAVDTEKPLTHSVYEARALAEAARKHKVATQMDNEGHASNEVRQCAEWLQAGVIGPVREAHIWTDRPIWPQGIPKRPASKPVPASLDWDLWLGPAPHRDYHDHLHPFAWRGWWDFGTGALGDMGCHWWDAAFWGLKLGEAKSFTIEAEHEGNSEETAPHWSTVTFNFPARGSLPPVKVTWWDGRRRRQDAGPDGKYDIANLPPKPEAMDPSKRLDSNGAIYVGEKAVIVNNHHNSRIYPEAKAKELEYPRPGSIIPRSVGHKKEWLQAIKGGPPAGSNFADYGGPLAEMVLLGNLAIRAGCRFEWDAEALQAKNCPQANAFVRRDYRKGWEL
jgi:predicted dehydrogenase